VTPKSAWVLWSLVLLYLGPALILVFGESGLPLSGHVEQTYHLPQIDAIRTSFPAVDMGTAVVPMLPVYHWFMAGVSLLTDSNLILLRVVQLVVGLLTLLAVFRLLEKRISRARALYFTCLFAVLPSVFEGSVRLQTDVPGLLFCVLALHHLVEPPTRQSLLRGAIYATIAVALRQLNIWLLPLLAFRGWQMAKASTGHSSLWVLALPVVLVGGALASWGHVLPARMADHHFGFPNLHAPILCLAVLGLYSGPFYAFWRSEDGRATRPFGIALCFVAIVFGASFFSRPPSFIYGPLWTLVTDDPLSSSLPLPLLVLAVVGGAFCTTLALRSSEPSDRSALLLLLIFLGVSTVPGKVFQRYHEAYLILFLAWTLGGARLDRASAKIGPVLLLVGLYAGVAFHATSTVFSNVDQRPSLSMGDGWSSGLQKRPASWSPVSSLVRAELTPEMARSCAGPGHPMPCRAESPFKCRLMVSASGASSRKEGGEGRSARGFNVCSAQEPRPSRIVEYGVIHVVV